MCSNAEITTHMAELVEAARVMRHFQKLYFQTRDAALVRTCKMHEGRVDFLLGKLNPVQAQAAPLAAPAPQLIKRTGINPKEQGVL